MRKRITYKLREGKSTTIPAPKVTKKTTRKPAKKLKETTDE